MGATEKTDEPMTWTEVILNAKAWNADPKNVDIMAVPRPYGDRNPGKYFIDYMREDIP